MMFLQSLATNLILKRKLKSSHQMISKDTESSCVCQNGNIISLFQKRAQWEEALCIDYGIR